MGRFSKYLGKFDVTIDGEKLELDVKMKDIKKFLTMNTKDGMSEESIDKVTNTFTEIMVRSYPDEPKEELEEMVGRNFMQFMTELFIAMGWTTRDDMDTNKKNLVESLSLQNKEKL